ncbi:MAG: helix-turn-helix transcriptional regulator [Bacteroidales bacterium]|nr:helix-turn-helix transcriptional regulator [Bacteroidales bacterium]
MKTHAYNNLYLEDAMNNLGTMLDCAVHAVQCDLLVFYEMFLFSGVASQMEAGNPRYLSGMSGMELMQLVLEKSSDKTLPIMNYVPFDRTPDYWAGWALAYYQWYSAYSFSFIQRNGLSISTVLSLYPTLHEADLSKFVQTADALIQQHLDTRKSRLKTIRKQSRFTQKELAELSGVTLRMIQAYEQGDQDILKAEAQTVFALARVLGCAPEVICG